MTYLQTIITALLTFRVDCHEKCHGTVEISHVCCIAGRDFTDIFIADRTIKSWTRPLYFGLRSAILLASVKYVFGIWRGRDSSDSDPQPTVREANALYDKPITHCLRWETECAFNEVGSYVFHHFSAPVEHLNNFRRRIFLQQASKQKSSVTGHMTDLSFNIMDTTKD